MHGTTYNGLYHCCPLGADARSIRRILDVAAGDEPAVFFQERCTDAVVELELDLSRHGAL